MADQSLGGKGIGGSVADWPIYSQRDTRWAGKRLGLREAAAGSTLGRYGCAVTALAQKLTIVGVPWTPDRMQDVLLLGGGFRPDASRNLVAWWELPRLFPQFVFNGSADFSSMPVPEIVMVRIYERLRRNDPVILYVDASPYEEGLQQHFVLATGRLESGEIVIANPWNGKQETLRPYGRTDPQAICGMKWLDLKTPKI